VSQRVIGVKTAFWELRDTCNKRQAGSPPMWFSLILFGFWMGMWCLY
jgi:hypothetical protein